MKIDISTNLSAAIKSLQEQGRDLGPQMKRNMADAISVYERQVKMNLSGPILKRRTGNLMNSLRRFVDFEGGVKDWTVTGGIGVTGDVKYAKIHELGGEITPKKAKHLWLPISGAGPKSSARPEGQTALTPRDAMKLRWTKGMPSNLPHTFFGPKNHPTLKRMVMYYADGKGHIKAIYKLILLVKMPKRKYLQRSYDEVATLMAQLLMPEWRPLNG